ncbi:hypothetical protein SBRCBS47491_000329 [Sporothrix bragantina]|uniref:RNA helicase n=1 Tax=Sporothrix bragantina TaxID=671064 RepID=A0ABP0APD2_9PEZI
MAELDLAAAFIPALHKPSALLPIAKHRESLLYLIDTFPVVIVVGQTGSGKTTQIPQFLEQAGWCADGKVIAITQPRRVAATTVAVRVAEEYGCEIGKEVGYSIRFEDVTSSATRIKFMTDGLLIREALVDPLLSRYSVIMVDEAHERSISTDILLGLLKKIRRRRPELRIVISSATLQAEDFLTYFSAIDETGSGNKADGGMRKIAAPNALTRAGEEDEEEDSAENPEKREKVGFIISLEGRTYPIDILYLDKPAEDYVEKVISTVLGIHAQEPDGDILVFLTGREEIERCVQAVAEAVSTQDELSSKRALLPLPMYAGLTADEQMYVFDEAPEDTRKVIFATNIAEASVTISGVVYVVDSGFVKQRAYNPSTGIETLTTTLVSKAAAAQRAGRAGRTKPGKCFRLYTEESYLGLPDANVPEIQRSNLAPVVLQLKALGIDNVLRFPYFTAPPTELMIKALELLYSLGALDDYAKLTKPLGLRMAELAVEPMMAKTLLEAAQFGCLSEMLTIAAMTSREGNSSVWIDNSDGGRSSKEEKQLVELVRRRFSADEGDHLTLLNVYQAFVTKGNGEAKFCKENRLNFQMLKRAVNVRAQLRRFMERFGYEVPDDRRQQHDQQQNNPANKAEQIRRCLTTGYFAHAARMQPDGTFRNVAGGTVLHAHPTSLFFNRKADWVIFHEVMETGDKTYIRDMAKIEKRWLLEYAPDYYQTTERR